jgi:hypothetical protein
VADRRSGLGPLGHAALQRASETQSEITAGSAPRIGPRQPAIQENPSTTTTRGPGEGSAPERWFSFNSSRVLEAAYDSDAHRLLVRFVKPDGSVVYAYEGVLPNEWHNFRRASSAGKYINRVLNTKNYHPVTD